jgi:hypothetical protein
MAKVEFKLMTKNTLYIITVQNLFQAFFQKLDKNIWFSIILFSVGLFIWCVTTNTNLYQTQDTRVWICGSQWLGDCFLSIDSEACGRISKWPIWNNFVAFILSWFTDDQIKFWHYLNVVSFIVYLFIISFAARKFSIA